MQDSFTLFIEVTRKFIEMEYCDVESMEKDLNELRKDQDYLKNSAVVDLMDLSLADEFKKPIMKDKSSSDITNIPSFRKEQIDHYIGFISNDIRDGELFLLSNLSNRRFGYTRKLFSNGMRHEIMENLINNCAGHKNTLTGAIASRIVCKETDLVISAITNLDAKKDAAKFLEISVGANRLLRVASPKVKRHLASSDFAL